MEMRTKIKDSIKRVIPAGSDIVIGLSMALVGVYMIGYASGNEDGITDGIKRGGGEMLTKIVSKGELIMNNPDLGCYVFTAKKFDK